MNKISVKRALTIILVAAFLFIAPTADGGTPVFDGFVHSENFFIFDSFLRTELFFGTAKPDGSAVSEEEWQKFLADEVTPRFPAGFTVLAGDGQFSDDGKIISEKSFVLIVLYPLKTRKSSRLKIEQIRRAYLKAFQQKSVMRVDFPQIVQVSF
jgi:hypothetical protein